MVNLDEYLCSEDEHFNTNAQYWYFEFTGNNKPNTGKTFEVFIVALYEAYFFVQAHLNKPFGCIEKVNEISDKSNLNDIEKLILIDKLLGVLFQHPEKDKQSMVYLQLTEYRDKLSPYNHDQDIKSWKFDIDKIKADFQLINDTNEKEKFLMNYVFDGAAIEHEIDDIEYQYYENMGFFQWINVELKRIAYLKKLEANKTQNAKSIFQLSKKAGAKTDFIRILNALYEIRLFNKTDGQIPTKQEFFETMGGYFNVDLSKYHTNLSQALLNQPLEVNLKVFEDMMEVIKNAHHQTKTK